MTDLYDNYIGMSSLVNATFADLSHNLNAALPAIHQAVLWVDLYDAVRNTSRGYIAYLIAQEVNRNIYQTSRHVP